MGGSNSSREHRGGGFTGLNRRPFVHIRKSDPIAEIDEALTNSNVTLPGNFSGEFCNQHPQVLTRVVINILAVDDETSITTSVRLALKPLDGNVDVLADGLEAFDRIRERPAHYHVLILDHAMKKMSGLELLLALPLNSFPKGVILLSGCLTEDLKQKYTSLGVSKILEKPFDVEELRRIVLETVA